MAWQKCPVCNGLGRVNFLNHCTVCNGMKIINEVSGLPPVKDTNNYLNVTGNVISKSTDFRDNQEQFEGK